jgi:hypothetical protein
LDSDKDIQKIVIFQGCMWSEILLLFKLKGIVVSGGDVVRRHSLSYNQYKLSLFIILINIMINYFINSKGVVLRKDKYNIYDDDDKFINYSKEMYNTSNLDFRYNKYKEIMKSHIDFTNKILTDEIDLFHEYFKNKDEFIKYMENKKDKNMILNNNNNHTHNLINKPNIKNQYLTNKGDKREYHQSSVIKNDNQLVSYLETLGNIINNDSLTPKHKQSYIEEEWINLIKVNLDNDTFIKDKHSYNLYNLIKEAKLTLQILYDQLQLKNNFTFIYEELNKIDYLMLTVSIVLTVHKKLGFSNISIIIGNQILYLIYKNKKIFKKEYI